MNYLNADLHSHSIISDGTLTPEDLALRAKSNGVDLWSLTDHDEVRGQDRALTAAQSIGLPYTTGTEISVSFAGKTVHIVGLGFDHNNAELLNGLAATRSGRDLRAREMSRQLEQVGIAGVFEGALRYVKNPDLISRTHFARYLVETGVCADTAEVFRKYLTPGNPGFVEHKWAKLGDAVRWITAAQGIAIIAHPARYGFSPTEEYALITEFIAHSGQGIEVVTGSHTDQEALRYADVAREFNLLASRGSDFHSPHESRIDLGGLPNLPSDLTSVWSVLSERIH